MMSDDGASNEHGIEDQIAGIRDRAGRAMEACYFATSVRLYGEAARLAKSNGKLMSFVEARFHEMDKAQQSLNFRLMRECAIELIAIMEDEEHARRIEPNFPIEHYEGTASWMSTCLYENLAEATGNAVGFNSDGMHECIADGLQVCHRTGKLACISCFREYATDVYTSADDSMMAMHQCYTIMQREGGWSDRGDRRWYAALKLAWLQCLEGKLDAAIEMYNQALELCEAEEVPLTLECRVRVGAALDGALILAGRKPLKWKADAEGDEFELPPDGEWPALEVYREWNAAIADCCDQNFVQAIDRLTELDRKLADYTAHLWFENRLRLIAAMKLGGQSDRADRLAAQLKKKAADNGDHLTVRRLNVLEQNPLCLNPVVSLEPLDCGPFGQENKDLAATENKSDANAGSEESTDQESASEDAGEIGTSATHDAVRELLIRNAQLTDPTDQDALLTEYMAIPFDDASDHDRMGLLHFIQVLSGGCERGEEIWAWAQTVLALTPDEPSVMSMVAALGHFLRKSPNERMQTLIDGDEIEKTFRLTLSMDANRSGNHQRAGEFFLELGNYGEAERCLARAFRLERSDGRVATLLSDVYANTDRLRDSLAVLDACLREGCGEPEVAWQAAMNATFLNQHESVLTYLDKFTEVVPDQQWTHYYRALSNLQLGKFEDAIASAENEKAEHEYESTLHLEMIIAAARFGLGQTDEALEQLRELNKIGFASITEMTPTGIQKLASLLYEQAKSLPINHREREDFSRLLLETNLVTDEYFNMLEENEADGHDEVPRFLFRCILRQHLTASWATSRACLAHQKDWDHYLCEWGVISETADRAAELALEFQRKFLPHEELEVLDTTQVDGPYMDNEGVVFQGDRWNESEQDPAPEDWDADLQDDETE